MLAPLYTLDVYTLVNHLPEWAHFSKSFDLPDYERGSIVDFSLGCEPSKANSQRGVSKVVLNADGPENVTWFETRRCASASTADGHVLDCHNEALTLYACETYIQVTVISVRLASIEDQVAQFCVDGIVEPDIEFLNMSLVTVHLFQSYFGGFSEPDAKMRGKCA